MIFYSYATAFNNLIYSISLTLVLSGASFSSQIVAGYEKLYIYLFSSSDTLQSIQSSAQVGKSRRSTAKSHVGKVT